MIGLEVANFLSKGKIGVVPTDTIYGLVGSALKPEVVERIYKVKGRSPKKPFIILIAEIKDLETFGVTLDENVANYLKKNWPGPTSVIFPVSNDWQYLHRGKGTVAFRIPDKKYLIDFIKEIGPLVAPSANPEGKIPAKTVDDARSYFGSDVDFYVDGGSLDNNPSKLVEYKDGKFVILRK